MRGTKFLSLFLAVLLVLTLTLAGCQGNGPPETPVPRGYECAVYHEAGCAKEVVADGGELEVLDGGTVDIQSGASFNVSDGITLSVVAGLTTTGQIRAANGTVGAPAVSFSSDTDNGVYRITTNSWGLAAGGALAANVVSTGLTIPHGKVLTVNGTSAFSETMTVPAGTVTAPGMSYSGDTNTGVYRVTADTLGFAAGGVQGATVTTAGLNVPHGKAFTDSGTAHISETLTVSSTGVFEGAVTSRGAVAGTAGTFSGAVTAGTWFAYTTPISYTYTGSHEQSLTPVEGVYLLDPLSAVTITLVDPTASVPVVVYFYNPYAVNVTFAHTNFRTSTGAALVVGQYDNLVIMFLNGEWQELSFLTNS
ncbi:MAG: hypothetical protein WC869_10340 [Phycisphaerae bacterium]